MMISIPELLTQMGPVWHAVLAFAALCLWLVALRSVLRDLTRPTAVGAHLARCGLPPEASERARQRDLSARGAQPDWNLLPSA